MHRVKNMRVRRCHGKTFTSETGRRDPHCGCSFVSAEIPVVVIRVFKNERKRPHGKFHLKKSSQNWKRAYV